MENDDIEVIQINIHGEDKPGLTSSLTDILARYDAAILDIGQANIHQTLSMGILFKTDSIRSGDIMKDLLFKAYELGIQIRFQPITVEQYEQWVGMQGKNRYIITMLGRKLTAQQIAAVTRVVAEQGLNIDSILRLTGRVSLDENARAPKSCIELSVRGNPHDKEGMQSRFLQLSTELGMDISFQKDDMFRRSRRLICFDMDSTLIETEVIDELAERAGVGAEVRAITESAMRGEIDFAESFRRRVAMLKGLDESVMADIAEHLPFTEGLDRLMHVLKRLGFKTAILSGGFTYFGNYLRRKYGFDYVYANELEIEDGKLTGRYLGDIGRRQTQGRAAEAHLAGRERRHRADDRRRGRGQRPADAERRRPGNRIPRQTERSRRRPASRSRRSGSTEFSISSATRIRISMTSNSNSKISQNLI